MVEEQRKGDGGVAVEGLHRIKGHLQRCTLHALRYLPQELWTDTSCIRFCIRAYIACIAYMHTHKLHALQVVFGIKAISGPKSEVIGCCLPHLTQRRQQSAAQPHEPADHAIVHEQIAPPLHRQRDFENR